LIPLDRSLHIFLLLVGSNRAKPTNPLIPKYLIGFATRQSICADFISVIMAGKMGSLSLQV
jgi:hypothetical protein